MSGSDRVIIDGDGHVFEDLDGMVERLPEVYRREFKAKRLWTGVHLMPPTDHQHSYPIHLRGMFSQVSKIEASEWPSRWQTFQREVGIAHSVLYPSHSLRIGLVRDVAYSLAIARAYNEWLSETFVQPMPGQFTGVALVPAQAGGAAVEELRYAVEDLGLKGALMPTVGLPNHFGDERYLPIYEAAAALDTPVVFHGGHHIGFGFDNLNSAAAAHALGHPFSLLIALAGLTFNGVFERFPSLRVGFLEGGAAWLLLAVERFEESFSAFVPLVMPEIGRFGPDMHMGEYICDLVAEGRLYSGCEGGEAHLADAIQSFGCSPFVYSSDFPHEVDASTCTHELKEFEARDIDEDARAATLGGNALRLYGLTI